MACQGQGFRMPSYSCSARRHRKPYGTLLISASNLLYEPTLAVGRASVIPPMQLDPGENLTNVSGRTAETLTELQEIVRERIEQMRLKRTAFALFMRGNALLAKPSFIASSRLITPFAVLNA